MVWFKLSCIVKCPAGIHSKARSGPEKPVAILAQVVWFKLSCIVKCPAGIHSKARTGPEKQKKMHSQVSSRDTKLFWYSQVSSKIHSKARSGPGNAHNLKVYKIQIQTFSIFFRSSLNVETSSTMARTSS